MPVHPLNIYILGGDAGLAGPVPLAEYFEAGPADADGLDLDALAARAVERCRGSRQVDARVAVLPVTGLNAPAVVVSAVRALRQREADVAVVIAADAGTGAREWAALTLVAGDRDPDGAIARVVAASEGGSLGAALASNDLDLSAIGLVEAQALEDAETARMLAAWADEAALDLDSLPSRSASPLLAPVSPVRALAGVCAVARAVGDRTVPPLTRPAGALARPWGADIKTRPWISGQRRQSAVWTQADAVITALVFAEPAMRSTTRKPSWPAALVLLGAGSREELARLARQWADDITTGAPISLAAWAARINGHLDTAHQVRASILARHPDDLAAKLRRLIPLTTGPSPMQTPDGVAFADAPARGRTAFVFPGQGAQFLGMFGDLCHPFPVMQDLFDRLQATYPATEYCAPAQLLAPPTMGLSPADSRVLERAVIGVSRGAMVTLVGSLALSRLLTRAGIVPDVMAGYSNGENVALVSSGVWELESFDELFGLMHVVRVHDEDDPIERGACIAVGQASGAVVAEVMATVGGDVAVALENCPDQRVLFGAPADIDQVAARLREAGAVVVPMAFDRGHHTARYQRTVERLRPVYRTLRFRSPRVPLYSCITAAPVPDDPDAIRDLAVGQWARAVRFGATVERMYDDGVRTFVEVGPGSTLTGFVRNTLRGRPHLALHTHAPGRPGLDQFLHLLGRLFTLGHDIDLAAVRTVDLEPGRHIADDSEPLPPVALAADAALSDTRVPGPVTPVAPSPGGTPASLAAGHFSLMREFLDQQARVYDRVLAAVAGGAATGHRPHATGPVLLGDRVQLSPGHLIAERRFDPAHDLFLWDHAFGADEVATGEAPRGLPVIPFTVSLEMAVQAARRLHGKLPSPLHVRHARGSRWLALDTGTLDMRVDAQHVETRPGLHDIHVRLFETGDGQPRPSFETFFPLDEALPPATPLPRPAPIGDGVGRAERFNARLFHGPLFLCLREVIGLDGSAISVRTRYHDGAYFADRAPVFETSPALLDAASQAVALWLAEQGGSSTASYPYLIERYVQYSPLPLDEDILITASVVRTGPASRSDVEFARLDGTVCARMFGLSMRVFDFPAALHNYLFGPRTQRLSAPVSSGDQPGRRLAMLPPALVDKGQGIWLRTIAALALCPEEQRQWQTVADADRVDWLLCRLVAKETAAELMTADGRSPDVRTLVAQQDGTHFRVRPLGAAPDTGVQVSVTRERDAVVATAAALTLVRGDYDR